MTNIWRCPECETINTEDKCIVCGCLKPKAVNTSNRSNIIQEQLKINNNINQESLKSVQYTNQHRDKNQYKIDNQQDQINSVKSSESNRKKKNRKIKAIIILNIIVITIACASLWTINNYKDIVEKNNNISEAGLPDITEPSISHLTQMTTETTAPVSEKKTTTTVVPESVTENIVEDMIIMPSLMRKDYSSAIKILDTIGVQYNVTYSEKKYVDVGENCVYSQKPASGKKISKDTVIEIGISTYKPETTTQSTTKPTDTTTSQTIPPATTPTSASSDKLEYTKEWNETEISETLYIKTSCYSRSKAVVGADSVKKYKPGTKINVVAATDTGFYKLKDGTFIHSDYVTDEKPETKTESSSNTEPYTLSEPDTERINLDGDITTFSTFNSYFIDNLPIEGTTWQDYYWESDNESCVQFVSGMLVTYFEGEATITLTYISDPYIVATAKVRVVS